LLWGTIAGALLASPWLSRAWTFSGPPVGLNVLSSGYLPKITYEPDYGSYLWYLLGPLRNYLLSVIALLGLILAAYRPRERVLAVWTLAMVGLCVPWAIRLSSFRPDDVIITLFLPMAFLSGSALVSGLDRLKCRCSRATMKTTGIVLVSALCLWGVVETRSIVNPITILATNADVRAIRWLESNTPIDARFLINVTVWKSDIYRGVDGGWWILPLTGRQTILPPITYNLGNDSYVSEVSEMAKRISRLKGCTAEFWEVIRQVGATHIYLGTNKGSLESKDLVGCAGVDSIYAIDGISIYRIQSN